MFSSQRSNPDFRLQRPSNLPHHAFPLVFISFFLHFFLLPLFLFEPIKGWVTLIQPPPRWTWITWMIATPKFMKSALRISFSSSTPAPKRVLLPLRPLLAWQRMGLISWHLLAQTTLARYENNIPFFELFFLFFLFFFFAQKISLVDFWLRLWGVLLAVVDWRHSDVHCLE